LEDVDTERERLEKEAEELMVLDAGKVPKLITKIPKIYVNATI